MTHSNGDEFMEMLALFQAAGGESNADCDSAGGNATPGAARSRTPATPKPDTPSSRGSTAASGGDHELSELSLLDILTQAASDVMGAIPSERCVVYVYDKVAHLLRPQVVVDYHDSNTAHNDKAGLNAEESDAGEKPVACAMTSFPPVVGMVSCSFLQRRCLRMQEPNPHRNFHRDYDAPKDLEVDSILCAPLILRRRATAVIQLLNRIDPDVETYSSPFEQLQRTGTSLELTEDGAEVKLRRHKSIKPHIRLGFSSKDEQKLLHFTTHISQTIEASIKLHHGTRSQAKHREDTTTKAMELLNSLNGKLTARVDESEELVKVPKADNDGHVYMRRATLTRLPRSVDAPIDMLGALVVIMRIQAMFRGRRERRAEKFAEALERYREQRERMRSVMVMQRVTRRVQERRPDTKHSVAPLGRKYTTYRFREGTNDTRRPSRGPTFRTQPVKPLPKRSPAQLQQHLGLQSVAESERIKKAKRSSAVTIQKAFRRHQQRRKARALADKLAAASAAMAGHPSDAITNVVKLQSFVRGNLARKWLRRALAPHRGPPIVCLRVASPPAPEGSPPSNQLSHDVIRTPGSQICVYAMPERSTKALLVHRRSRVPRHRLEALFDDSRAAAMLGKTPQCPQDAVSARNDDVDIPSFSLHSRKLVASGEASEKAPKTLFKPTAPPAQPHWRRAVSAVREIARTPNCQLVPPGVELVKGRRVANERRVGSSSSRAPSRTSPRTRASTSGCPQACGLDDASSNLYRAQAYSLALGATLPLLSQPQARKNTETGLLCGLLPAQPRRSATSFTPSPRQTRRPRRAGRSPRSPRSPRQPPKSPKPRHSLLELEADIMGELGRRSASFASSSSRITVPGVPVLLDCDAALGPSTGRGA